MTGGTRLVALVVSALLALSPGAFAADRGGEPLNLPDLTPKPPYDVVIEKPDQVTVGEQPLRALRFATTTYNIGVFPLDLRAQSIPVVEPAMDSQQPFRQCVRYIRPACLEWRLVGTPVYHTGHGHWHLDEYASYDLLPVTPEGLPDFDVPPIAPGVKASFCLLDSERAPGYTQPDIWGQLFYDRPVFSGCGLARQGISPGWGDTYGRSLPGQQIVVDDVPPGIYAIVITINYTGRLYETDLTDNRSWAVINLGECEEVEVLRTGIS